MQFSLDKRKNSLALWKTAEKRFPASGRFHKLISMKPKIVNESWNPIKGLENISPKNCLRIA